MRRIKTCFRGISHRSPLQTLFFLGKSLLLFAAPSYDDEVKVQLDVHTIFRRSFCGKKHLCSLWIPLQINKKEMLSTNRCRKKRTCKELINFRRIVCFVFLYCICECTGGGKSSSSSWHKTVSRHNFSPLSHTSSRKQSFTASS